MYLAREAAQEDDEAYEYYVPIHAASGDVAAVYEWYRHAEGDVRVAYDEDLLEAIGVERC